MSQQELEELSLFELAQRTGESPDDLLHWRSLHLIGDDRREVFSREDLEGARLIQFCLRRGAAIEALARAEQMEQGFVRRYVSEFFPAGIGPAYSLAEAAEMAGLDADFVRRLHEIGGTSGPTGTFDRDDIGVLRGWKVALEAGLPEEALFQLVRVYVDALGRVAEAEMRLFHFYVHERLRAAGLSGRELRELTDASSKPMRRLVEPALLHFHRKGMTRALYEDILLHLAEYSDASEGREAPAQLRLAIAFVDLASFTPLTESMGDVAAARVIAQFSGLVREVVSRHHGQVAERIGDAFLLTFPEPKSAVACVLEIEARTAEEDQFPAIRGGIHFGPVLYREGGYVGANVNIAARVAAEAGRSQLLVTAEVRGAADDLPMTEFVTLGERRLKGVADEIELFDVRALDKPRVERMTDPVCGMELTKSGVAATLALEGAQVSFCSEKCLRMFVESRRSSA